MAWKIFKSYEPKTGITSYLFEDAEHATRSENGIELGHKMLYNDKQGFIRFECAADAITFVDYLNNTSTPNTQHIQK